MKNEIKEMEYGIQEMKDMPVGHIMTVIIKGNPMTEEHFTKTYEKINQSQVELIESVWRS